MIDTALARTELGSAGQESIAVRLSEDFADAYKISTRARYDPFSEPQRIFSAPLRQEPITMEYTETQLSSTYEMARSYTQGKSNLRQFHATIPCVEKKGSRAYIISTYEKALFVKAKVTALFNPALATMKVAAECGIKKMFLTMRDHEWRRQVRDLGRQYEIEQIFTDEADEVVFCGSNGPQFHYMFTNAVSLHVDPSKELFFQQSSECLGTRIVTTYERGARIYDLYLPEEGRHYTYNPLTVSQMLGIDFEYFFVHSNNPLQWTEEDSLSGPLVYLSSYPPPSLLNDAIIRKDKGILYDLEGEGTYFSRRDRMHAFAKLNNLKVAPFLSYGPYAISPSSLRPTPVDAEGTDPFFHNHLDSSYKFVPLSVHPKQGYDRLICVWSPDPLARSMRMGMGNFVLTPATFNRHHRVIIYKPVPGTRLHYFLTFNAMEEKLPYLQASRKICQRPFVAERQYPVRETMQHYNDIYYEVMAKGIFNVATENRNALYSFFNKYPHIWFLNESADLGLIDTSKCKIPVTAFKRNRRTVFLFPPGKNEYPPEWLVVLIASNGMVINQVSRNRSVSYWTIDNQFTLSDRVEYLEYGRDDPGTISFAEISQDCVL